MTYERMPKPPTFAVIAVVLLAGCIGGYTDPGVEQGGIEIAPNSELTTNDSGFFVENASIHFTLHAEQKETFDHVVLCLYTEDGDILGSTDLGPFTTPTDTTRVTIQSAEIPKYIVVSHPRFAEYDNFDYEILIWNADNEYYAPGSIEDIAFTYPRTDKVGVCA